jgi:hypothetical protein
MTKPSNCGGRRGRWGAVAARVYTRAAESWGEARRKGGRLNTTGNGLSSELGTPLEPKKLTCDLLSPCLKFESAVFSHA